MNLDLIAMITMLIIMIIVGIGLLLMLVILWYGDDCKTDEDRYNEAKKLMDRLNGKKNELLEFTDKYLKEFLK